MNGRIITIILKKGLGFPLFGLQPTFWPFMVSPELSWCLWVSMYYNECIMRLKVSSKKNLSPFCAKSVLTSFCVILNAYVGIPPWYNGKESACQYRRCRRFGFDPWMGKISWWRKWQPTPVFLPEKNPLDRGAWQATTCGVAKSRSDLTEHAPMHDGYVVLLKTVPCPLHSCVRETLETKTLWDFILLVLQDWKWHFPWPPKPRVRELCHGSVQWGQRHKSGIYSCVLKTLHCKIRTLL